ncbi:MAG: hypothetical protein WCE50_12800 [Candidatus Acidiferrum sp.]
MILSRLELAITVAVHVINMPRTIAHSTLENNALLVNNGEILGELVTAGKARD